MSNTDSMSTETITWHPAADTPPLHVALLLRVQWPERSGFPTDSHLVITYLGRKVSDMPGMLKEFQGRTVTHWAEVKGPTA